MQCCCGGVISCKTVPRAKSSRTTTKNVTWPVGRKLDSQASVASFCLDYTCKRKPQKQASSASIKRICVRVPLANLNNKQQTHNDLTKPCVHYTRPPLWYDRVNMLLALLKRSLYHTIPQENWLRATSHKNLKVFECRIIASLPLTRVQSTRDW